MPINRIIIIFGIIIIGLFFMYYYKMRPTIINIKIYVKDDEFIIKDQTFCDEIIYLTKIKETYSADSIVYYEDDKRITFK